MNAHAVLPAIAAARCGRIVNMVSGVGGAVRRKLVPLRHQQGGLIRLTEGLAIDAADYGVAVLA